MKLREFKEKVDGAPIELEQVAYMASDVVDDGELQDAGDQFLAAQQKLLNLLDDHGIELG